MIRGQNLPAITQIADSDVLIVDSTGGGTRKITYAQLCQAVKQTLGIREVIDSVNITEDGYLMGGKVIADEFAKLNNDKPNKDILTASTITSGTLLDAVLRMGENTHRLFIASPYRPSDVPNNTQEYAIDVIKEQNTSRIIVVAYEYSGSRIYIRTIFSNNWNSPWRSVILE